MKPFTRKTPVLGREHFVRFAGATGDFNPIHFDAEFAKGFGIPAVISQGPLTCMLALDALAAEVGLDNLSSFKARTTSPVFPDTETEVTCDGDGNITVSDGKTVFLTATVEAKRK
jgi:acyl dehydratase